MKEISLGNGHRPAVHKDNSKQSVARRLPSGCGTYHNNDHDEVYPSTYPWRWVDDAGRCGI